MTFQKNLIFFLFIIFLTKFEFGYHINYLSKLNTYEFSLSTLKIMQSYVSERKQRSKINQTYSSWEEILFGLPHRFILGPILFNIFLNNLLLVVQNIVIASYSDDSTI